MDFFSHMCGGPGGLLTRVNLDVDLLLAGSEQDGLITKIQKSVSVHTQSRGRAKVMIKKQET